jgi:hypothetical protein
VVPLGHRIKQHKMKVTLKYESKGPRLVVSGISDEVDLDNVYAAAHVSECKVLNLYDHCTKAVIIGKSVLTYKEQFKKFQEILFK